MGLRKVRMLELQQVDQHRNGHHSLDAFHDKFSELMAYVSSVVVVSDDKLKLALLGLFAQGHLLLEDLPGVGKTLLAKTISSSLDGVFSRIQCTPDLLPSDITGTSVFDIRNQTFSYVPGPIFANVVVADELNRAGPRTQSALLEAMAEGQVSADGTIRPLPRPFFTIATQNMVETHGTFPQPNSQLDRFIVSMALGLPTPHQEMEILNRWEQPPAQKPPLLTPEEVASMQHSTRTVAVAISIKQYIVNLTAASRQQSQFTLGVSPRGSAAMLRACQAWAAFATLAAALALSVLIVRFLYPRWNAERHSEFSPSLANGTPGSTRRREMLSLYAKAERQIRKRTKTKRLPWQTAMEYTGRAAQDGSPAQAQLQWFVKAVWQAAYSPLEPPASMVDEGKHRLSSLRRALKENPRPGNA